MNESQAIVLAEDASVATFSRKSLSPAGRALLRDMVAKDLSDPEYDLFLRVCEIKALNPWSRQICAIVRKTKDGGRTVSHQVTVAGYYSMAARTGRWEGQTEPEWCGDDGQWRTAWLASQPPLAARIGVFKQRFQLPVYGVAHYQEYYQESNPVWRRMPAHMLAKVAKTIALREAFPEELGDVAVEDMPLPEMAQAYPVEKKRSSPRSPKLYQKLIDLGKEIYPDQVARHEWLARQDVTPDQLLDMDAGALQLLIGRLPGDVAAIAKAWEDAHGDCAP